MGIIRLGNKELDIAQTLNKLGWAEGEESLYASLISGWRPQESDFKTMCALTERGPVFWIYQKKRGLILLAILGNMQCPSFA